MWNEAERTEVTVKKSGTKKGRRCWAYAEQPAHSMRGSRSVAPNGVRFSKCVYGRWKEVGETGLDLRVAGTSDKKFWESQELREDEDDQLIRTNAVLKNIMLVVLRRAITLNSAYTTALSPFLSVTHTIVSSVRRMYFPTIKEWGTQVPRKYLLLDINPCNVTSLNKKGFVCYFSSTAL